jgi:NADH-quinone oxidoreductase subunit J
MIMSVELVLFYLFSSLAVISSLMVIRSENPVHSVLFLILAFFNASGLLLLLEVEFLAMLFIIVYVGAVAVLFLFVVMMLNIKVSQDTGDVLKYLSIGAIIGIIFLLEIFLVVEGNLISLLNPSDASPAIIEWSQKNRSSNQCGGFRTNYVYLLFLLLLSSWYYFISFYDRSNYINYANSSKC